MAEQYLGNKNGPSFSVAARCTAHNADPTTLGGTKSGYVRHVPLIGRLTRANYWARPQEQLILPRYARRKFVEPVSYTHLTLPTKA